MNQSDFFKYLNQYKEELQQIASRFLKGRDGMHIHQGDDIRLHEIVIEVRDLCDDGLGTNSYSRMIISHYNDGCANFLQSPSYHSVNQITAVVRSLIKRVERNKTLLEDKKFTLVDDGLPSLLHPTIVEHAYAQFKNGHYRDAVLNSIVAIFDFIRARTGLHDDGSDLIGRAVILIWY
jgi:hypothetical protein